MVYADVFGCPVTVDNPVALDAFNKTMMGFLAHSATTPIDLVESLKAAPDFALAHATKGLFLLTLARRELYEPARQSLSKARQSAARTGVTGREAHFIEALSAWLGGRPGLAIAEIEAVLRTHPHDALAMKLSQAIRFMMGDLRGMRTSVERVLPAYGEDHPAHGYTLGCHAFTLEETGEYRQAEVTGRRSLDYASNDAWGLHAVAHVYDMTGRAKEGATWLYGHETVWMHCNNFGYHVWWHLALLHLDMGEYDEVLALYDTKIRADKTDDYRDISNGASLLMRLELEGVDVGERWAELAEKSAGRVDDGCLVFADMHYLLALLRHDDAEAATALIAHLHQNATTGDTDMAAVARNPGIAACNGLEAFCKGNFDTAFKDLAQARNAMQAIGGSHAQRDVFERMTIEAAIRAGHLREARIMLDERSRLRSADDNFARTRRGLISRSLSRAGNMTNGARSEFHLGV